MVTGGIEISYSPEHPEEKSKARKTIQNIIEESGATITHTYTPTDKDRRVDLIYELDLRKEESLEEIRHKILDRFPKVIENVSTLVDE